LKAVSQHEQKLGRQTDGRIETKPNLHIFYVSDSRLVTIIIIVSVVDAQISQCDEKEITYTSKIG
jgi:hypothetical protein